MFSYELNDRTGDESKVAESYINTGFEFRVLSWKKRTY